MQRDGEALGAGLGRPPHDGRVVAAQLGVAGAARGGAIEVLEDERVKGRGAVVAGEGMHVHAEGVLGRRGEAQVAGGAEHHGADVQRAAGAMGRDEGRVQGDGEADAEQEVRVWDGGDADHGGGVLHAGGVFTGAEEEDLVRWRAVRFQAFEGLLAVVESGREAVHAEVGVFDQFGSGPGACLGGVAGFDVAVAEVADGEVEGGPVDVGGGRGWERHGDG